MKWSLVLALVFGGIAAAQDPAAAPAPDPNVLDQFQWQEAPDPHNRLPVYKNGYGDYLDLGYGGTGPLQSTLRTIGPAVVSKITAKHYAIVGTLKYTNVAAGTYLEMWSYFAPEQPGGPEGAYFSRTLAEAGPMAKLEGTDDGRDFSLPFDATGARTKLIRLVLNVHFGGPGWIELRQVKLMQYPDTSVPSAPAASGSSSSAGKVIALKSVPMVITRSGTGLHFQLRDKTYPSLDALISDLKGNFDPSSYSLEFFFSDDVDRSSLQAVSSALNNIGISSGYAYPDGLQPRRTLEWKSFFLGILTTCLLLLAVAGIRIILRRWHQLRHARELRRIASLDT